MKLPSLDISLCVAALLSLAAIVAVYAANPTSHLQYQEEIAAQHVNFVVDDRMITSNVVNALSSDPMTTSLKIHVDTMNGVVGVKGIVPNAIVGAHLLQVVATIEGVRGVRNSLKIPALG